MTHNPVIIPPFQQPQETLGQAVSFAVLRRLALTQTPWFESADEIRAAIQRGRETERLLNWVRSQMRLRLSPVERHCIELYYFENLNYRQAAEILGVNVTSVYRGVRRGIRKLRTAAQNHPPQPRRRSRASTRTRLRPR